MGAARVYKFNTPYAGTDVADLTYAQTTDTMYLAHLSYPPSKIVRAGPTSWTFQTVTFGTATSAPGSVAASPTTPNTTSIQYVSVSYVVTAVVDTTGQESVASSSAGASNDLTLSGNFNTVSWAAVSGASRYYVYKTTVNGFYGYVGQTTGTSFRDQDIGPDYSRSPPIGVTPFNSANNYPSTVTLFQQRLVWARTTNAPNGIFTSRSAQLENMNYSVPQRADDAITFAIVSGQATSINGLTSTSTMLGLASDGVYLVDGDGSGGVLAANSAPLARRQIGRGAGRLPAIVADSVVFYSPALGNTVRTIGFDYTVNGLRSNDVSIFSPHLFEGHTIVSWCYQREPRSLIWAVRDDGKLLCFTWEEAQGVWGWTWCDTQGDVLSCCSISENGQDSVYFVVERIINGVTKTYIEQLAEHLWTDVKTTCFVDCALTATYDSPVSVVSGLWHLEGETNVAGIVDGVPVDGLTVTNGQVTLPDTIGTGSVITLGLPYLAEIETLPLRTSNPGMGTNVGRIQTSQQAVLTVLNSANMYSNINGGDSFPVRPIDDQSWTDPFGLTTGDIQVVMDNRSSTTLTYRISQIAASPMTILGITQDPVFGG